MFGLQWKLRPVTSYEFMSTLVIYGRLQNEVQERIMQKAQVVIDFVLGGESLDAVMHFHSPC
jgi:hypothetical protein